jgi:hypothetical protein
VTEEKRMIGIITSKLVKEVPLPVFEDGKAFVMITLRDILNLLEIKTDLTE